MRVCKIDGCENKHDAKGFCGMHYWRWKRNGDPNIIKGHGYSYHFLYKVWQQMKDRCYNENCYAYKNYGGRGITVCKEWMSAKVFIEWALSLWEKGLQIDRKDNNKDYCPENCRFVTRLENIHNTRLLRETNTSGYRGVHRVGKKWRAQIRINDKQKHLGYFNTKKEAALVYDQAVPDNRPRNFF